MTHSSILSVEDYIEHYGVKGMRWGVVDKEDAAKEPKKKSSLVDKVKQHNLEVNTTRQKTFKARAEKADVRINELNAELAALPKGFRSLNKKRTLIEARNISIKQRNADLKKASKPATTGMTATQKKVAIGVGVAAVLVGSHYVGKYYDLEGARAAIQRGKNQVKYGDVFKKNAEFARQDLSPEQVLEQISKGVNPNYRSLGGQMNCRRCSFAYELRRRGYDVTATPSALGVGQNESGLVNALIKGDRNLLSKKSMSAFAGGTLRTRGVKGDTRTYSAATKLVDKLDDLAGALSSHPDKARGEVVFDMGGFAHSMQWELFDGIPHIFDSQKGQHFPVTTEGLSALMSKWGEPLVMEITRLDDVDLDLAFLSRWAES